MGYFGRKVEYYDPVTDRNYYGPEEYIEDENDKRRARNKAGENYEIKAIRTHIANIKSSSDFDAIETARSEIEKACYLDRSQKLSFMRAVNERIQYHERVEEINREAKYRNFQREREKREKESEERRNALIAAKNRYKALSLFGKIKHFRHRPSTINVYQQTSEEINQLYRRR